ncbi:hypothetical protein CGLAUT_04035 [Corynebacterium glaucum]|uniref:hypothetical protein n=1 Tax=Corynebacterium glaucum TaxID=187491 RepID=UPI0025B4D636|nr:hypothetical protein [Corynebacterium glaucum]WJZ07307.1 hypothetical protein CGLAUT_04035 [Corynebacterium glaucum]
MFATIVLVCIVLLFAYVYFLLRRSEHRVADSDYALDTFGTYKTGGRTEWRNEEYYRQALASIPHTDQLVAQLRSPLAAGIAQQWSIASSELPALPNYDHDDQVRAAMRCAQRLMRINRDCATLLSAEQGNPDARLAIVATLDRDLRFADTKCPTLTLEQLRIRDELRAIADRARALKGTVESPRFFDDYLSLVRDYAALVVRARPVCFKRMRADAPFEPPPIGSIFYVFGCTHGLVPWTTAYSLDKHRVTE